MTIKLLLADDHTLVRQGIRALLVEAPEMEIVGEARDGVEAVKLAKEFQPDVALLDMAMPFLNGLEATKLIHHQVPKVRVIILSMYDDEEYILQAASSGASGYILKDVLVAELLEGIRHVKRYSSFYLSSSIADEYLSRQIREEVEGKPLQPQLERGKGAKGTSLLTPREKEILQLVAKGRTNKEIATGLGISIKTVEAHRANIMSRLDIHTVAELTRYAISKGLADL